MPSVSKIHPTTGTAEQDTGGPHIPHARRQIAARAQEHALSRDLGQISIGFGRSGAEVVGPLVGP